MFIHFEAGLIGFITGGIIEGMRGSSVLGNLKTDYGIRVERIKAMTDASVLKEYKVTFGENAKNADTARKYLIDSERLIAATVSISNYATEGLTYDAAMAKVKERGFDTSGLEEFTKAAWDIGHSETSKAGAGKGDANTSVWDKLKNKGAGIYSNIFKLLKDGETTSYIADRITSLDRSILKSEATAAVEEAKRINFSRSLQKTSLSEFDKASAIKQFVLKEKALERMYELGASGLEYDLSMAAGVLTEADAYKAFIRGENAVKEKRAVAKAATEKELSRVFDEAPEAPRMAEDAAAFGDVAFEDGITDERTLPQSAVADSSLPEGAGATTDVDNIISGMGSMGRTLYKRIVDPIAGEVGKAQELKASIDAFAYIYEAGTKGEPYKRSKAGSLHIKQINAIYEAGKKDAAAKVKAVKKTDAKVIRDKFYDKANVSKRSARILDGIASLIGRDIRFSEDIEGNARIDLEAGEIIISVNAKSGHTWAMIHEVYHALVNDAPAEAEALKKTVLDIARKNANAYAEFREKYNKTYLTELIDKNGALRADAAEYISEEMVADLIGYTLSRPAILEKLTGKERSVFKKFIDKLVSIFGGGDAKARARYFESIDAKYQGVSLGIPMQVSRSTPTPM